MNQLTLYKTQILLDYYPFGMRMFNRSSNSSEYRYGYQGSEKDDEVKGEGNSYNTYFRALDPRIGRWLTIDPKASSMPWQSPYCSMDNNPIWFNDPYGDKVRNGVSATVREKGNDVKTAAAEYAKMVKNHDGEVNNKTLDSYRRKSGLKQAEKNLNYWKNIESKVDDMISTFSEVMPEEFNFLDTKLFDSNGNTIDVVVNYFDKISPKGESNPAFTSIKATVGEQNDTYSWSGTFNSNNINISLFSNGLSTKWLANEFGDIDYFFNNVTPWDSKSFTKWRNTASSGSPGYLNDPSGAGQMSFKYQYRFQSLFKDYTKDLPKENIDNINYIIHR